jgi:hypothetical protein
MLSSGPGPESYITLHILVYEDKSGMARRLVTIHADWGGDGVYEHQPKRDRDASLKPSRTF